MYVIYTSPIQKTPDFDEACIIADDYFNATGYIVAVDIRDISDQNVRQRIVDFVTGIAFISDAKMRIIHKDGVYLIIPSNMSLPSGERERLQTLGLYKINV